MSRDYSGLSEYFCWLCDSVASAKVPPDRHYEDPGRVVRFCSWRHKAAYAWLAGL